MSEQGRALVRGALTRVTTLAVEVVVALLLMPFIVHSLGDRMYGAWALVASLLGFYGLLDFGLSLAVSRFVSRAIGQGDRRDADKHVCSAFYLFTAAGMGVFVIAGITALFTGSLIDAAGEVATMRAVLLIMGAGLAVSFPARCFQGVLTAHVRYDVISTTRMVAVLGRAGLIWLVLARGGGIVALATVTAAVSVVEGIALYLLADRAHGGMPLKWGNAGRKQVGELIRYGGVSFLAQIADTLRFHAYAPVISLFLGLARVTPYAIAFELTRRMGRAMQALVAIMIPVFSKQEGRGDLPALRSSYYFAYKVACYFGMLATAMMVMFAEPFIARWMGPGFDEVAPLVWIIAIGTFAAVIQIPTVNLLFGTSRHGFYAISNGAEAVVHIGLAVALVQGYGLTGVAVASAIPMVIAKLVLQPWWACRILDESLGRYHLRHTLPNLARPAVYVVVMWFVVRPFLSADYTVIFSWAGMCGAAFIPYILFTGFSADERALLLSSVRRSRA